MAAALLAGCSALPSAIDPVAWWHGLQGGAIAEQRPPPPGADQAYPNLASVPGKPAPVDAALHRQIADSLVADRANAQYAAAAAPFADPSPPTASPALFGRGSVPPPPPASAPQPASASLEAASAPPAPRPPPAAASKAPVEPAQTTALAPPSGADTPGSTSAPDAAPPPAFASAPPAPPGLPGAPVSASAVTPATPPTPPPKPPAPPPAAAKQVGAAVPVGFVAGSAVLPDESQDALKQLAGRRAAATIVVTGFGEAASPDPAAQSGALGLALSRAQAMAAALAAAGVPASSVRVDAEAAGRGGVARLVE